MRIPATTYRIQFNPNFGFSAAKKIVAYLAELGISDLYASPIFKARAGSTHGYDIVDPNQLNPELGSEAEFNALIDEIQQKEMGWLQDIVPNHMAYDSQNQFLMDILEHGTDSQYFNYFDIDWEHPYEAIKGKILTPLLGDFYGKCLENGEIKIKYDESGLTVNYYGLTIPLRIESYARFITHELGRLTKALGRENPDFIKLLGILYLLKNIPSETSGKQRKDQSNFVKAILWELYRDKPEIKEFIDRNIEIFNGEVGKPESFNLLDNLLSEQFFRLSFWKVGAEELNYRRFFTINELICVKNEDAQVFNQTHDLISQLVESGKINGLRIDHIDGLYDPTEYLERLREKVGDIYIVVEKIVELEKQYYSKYEELPSNWSIQGTSGYDFLNCLNSLFCFYQQDNYRKFSKIYSRFTGIKTPYEQIVIDKKRLIADKNLAGDVENLANFLKRIAGKYRYGRDFTLNGVRKAILEVLVLFPVYRTYTNQDGIRDRDRSYIEEVVQKAKANIPLLINEVSFLEKVLLLDYEESMTEEERNQWLRFVMKFQQFSGPLMAKGVEDTSLYVYNRMISLNEVGGTAALFGIPVSVFHNFNQKRQDSWPHSMNATSTHDTKRSKDVRARLNVISEIPEEWETQIKTWSEMNGKYKTQVKNKIVPDANDEYFLYQTLVGAFPFFDEEYPGFIHRIKDYVIKAVREAKVHTAWLRPDTDYEEGFVTFADKILQPTEENQFLEKLRSFSMRIAHYGILNSISQTLLKIATPGVPDLYQGTELWDLSLVDPDNRRPVNFEMRMSHLQDIKQRSQTDILGLIADLMAHKEDGRIKLFLIFKALEAKNKNLEVFQQGAYVPLEAMGQYQDRIVAFARPYRQTTAIAIVPRFLTDLVQPGEFPLGEKLWGDTRLEIPQGLRSTWKDAFSNCIIPESDTISVGEALQYFPVSLLIGEKQDS
ncbi:MAG TPA: malto-oligosyltrehalose synthase [Cyanobacteria bacterium UBA11149]|nr:malto-oligosyltrehalose synthase [Cyanobacteria bacterium UBA11367]HBE57667.1 malto-oligosyltrehalose synthase [Cyanobacteria bacterium UBA11366]HBK65859.1 malto-oligosyltrehalose synthase [Cyanobacteria bacterium UBA11166]HBR72871.1 malto-oligosyltrehalose synthase [Cyanobacteria bacterium UBA11159]HBS67835.1 malto-oligosyltrehalose synthase [Cyanobacteria bacterium UBA11153]HBW90224.1 malto-oligosyltrehalose synthase [Cyanobacteria bacterium UBA11149]HCA93306.1 malto-oligosyltrehalose sy